MHVYTIPLPGAGFIIGWTESQDKKNRNKRWYVALPKVMLKTIFWPFNVSKNI
ncbi:hypothetical protein A9K97_gp278 [Tokyovirus A1]|uniref:hypothetical protein n=1 Tax=Tokyovirus A1 TaxID=1826170 RepID=UPI0007A98C85|nr:hypothetical protein A9K97_gp278 [Tokyovirus A1]BAU80073.1 hypothetical protein [Tokyovirus A1]